MAPGRVNETIVLGSSSDEEERGGAAAEVIILGSSSDEEPSGEGAAAAMPTCPICFCDADSLCMFHCGHACCTDCAISFLSSKIEEGMIGERLRCFSVAPPCKERLRQGDVRRALGKMKGGAALWEKYRARALESTAGVTPCPQPGCEFRFIRDPAEPLFRCPSCKVKSCLECGTVWHHGLSHAANKARLANRGLLDFAAQNPGMCRRCPRCGALTEKISGCNAVSCRCGTAFCWGCGKEGSAYSCRCGRQ
jgi:E3 ubiquitin-protein ligase RNF144